MNIKKLILLPFFLLLLFNNAFAQVSDAILKAMEGKNVRVKLDKGHGISKGLHLKAYFSGEIQKVGQNTIIMIGVKEDNIEEIPKPLILSIKAIRDKPSKRIFDRWGAGTLGFFLGFGIGSYIQGDTKGGSTGLIWDLVNVTAMGTFFGIISQRQDVGNAPDYFTPAIGFTLVISLLASRIFQTVRPHVWYKKNLAFLEGIYLVPDIAYNGYVGIKGGLLYSTRF